MKVYFTGSHATGKTTLARFVSTNYKLPMITEVARMILSEKELHLETLRTDIQAVNDYQKQIFSRQIREEEGKEKFVSDRSLIDVLAYSAQHTTILPHLFYSPEIITYLETLRHPDTTVFFVRPSKATLKSDGVREHITWDGIIAIDAMVKLFLELWQLKHFQISTDNMQERIKLIDSVLTK